MLLTQCVQGMVCSVAASQQVKPVLLHVCRQIQHTHDGFVLLGGADPSQLILWHLHFSLWKHLKACPSHTHTQDTVKRHDIDKSLKQLMTCKLKAVGSPDRVIDSNIW